MSMLRAPDNPSPEMANFLALIDRIETIWRELWDVEDRAPKLADLLDRLGGEEASRLVAVQRVRGVYKFIHAGDRSSLRYGRVARGMVLDDGPPWPPELRNVFTRAIDDKASLEMWLTAQTNKQIDRGFGVRALPCACDGVVCDGVLMFVFATELANADAHEFGLVEQLSIDFAGLDGSEPEILIDR